MHITNLEDGAFKISVVKDVGEKVNLAWTTVLADRIIDLSGEDKKVNVELNNADGPCGNMWVTFKFTAGQFL